MPALFLLIGRGETMRRLTTSDVFKAFRVVAKAGLKEEFQKVSEYVSNGNTDANDIGMVLIFGIIEKLAGTEEEKLIYEFLSGPLEIKASEIGKMDALELINNLKEWKEVVGVEDWQAFFKSVSAFLR